MTMIFYFILILLLPLVVQGYLMSTYKKYSNVGTSSGITGAEAARKVLDENGLYNVSVEPVRGKLTDHYDPRGKVVRLSEGNYYGTSIAAISVATHECGHAVQDSEGYAPLRIRHALVPVANLGSNVSWIFILIGLLLSSQSMLLVGIVFFSLAILFQLVTLPVEYNASSRALNLMTSSGMIRNNEEGGARKVLNAAALTYVAAALIAVLELLRFVLMFIGMNNED